MKSFLVAASLSSLALVAASPVAPRGIRKFVPSVPTDCPKGFTWQSSDRRCYLKACPSGASFVLAQTPTGRPSCNCGSNFYIAATNICNPKIMASTTPVLQGGDCPDGGAFSANGQNKCMLMQCPAGSTGIGFDDQTSTFQDCDCGTSNFYIKSLNICSPVYSGIEY